MAESALSELVVWHDRASGIFPAGEHCWPADLEMLTGLVAALRGDLAETHFVPIARLVVAEEVAERMPLRLTHLRAFLAAHRSRLGAALGHERVVANSLAHGARRIARLRELGAPEVIVDREVAALARLESARWEPQLDPCVAVPDVLETASVVDVEARRDHDVPLIVDADIADLVLLAAQCCILPGAPSIDALWVEGVDWVDFPVREDDDERGLPEDVVRVRPVVDGETIELLAFADVRGVPEAASLGPGGALLRVHVATSEQED